MDYKVLPSLHEESVEGWVWLDDETCTEQNEFIKVTYSQKSAILYRRKADKHYRFKYNSKVKEAEENKLISSETSISYRLSEESKAIIFSKYYRLKLGIDEKLLGKEIQLKISNANFLERNLTGYWNHPNPSISVAYRIAIISFAISIVSLLFSFFTLIFPTEGISIFISKLCFSSMILVFLIIFFYVLIRTITN
jgi:hypothetical protein